MIPVTHNLVGKYRVYIGTDRVLTLTFPVEMGDMTGYTFTGKIKTKSNNTYVMNIALSFNPTTRVLTERITNADLVTAQAVKGTYKYDIKMKNASGLLPTLIQQGDIEIDVAVTDG